MCGYKRGSEILKNCWNFVYPHLSEVELSLAHLTYVRIAQILAVLWTFKICVDTKGVQKYSQKLLNFCLSSLKWSEAKLSTLNLSENCPNFRCFVNI